MLCGGRTSRECRDWHLSHACLSAPNVNGYRPGEEADELPGSRVSSMGIHLEPSLDGKRATEAIRRWLYLDFVTRGRRATRSRRSCWPLARISAGWPRSSATRQSRWRSGAPGRLRREPTIGRSGAWKAHGDHLGPGAIRGLRDDPVTPEIFWSGRPDSNRRRPAWEAGILPLNYGRSTPSILLPGPITSPTS